MNSGSEWIACLVCALGLSVGGCESAPVKEDLAGEERAPKDPDQHPWTSAASAFEAAFPGWSWATLAAERREAVEAGIAEISQAGPPAWVSLRRARQVSLDAIRAGEIFGAEPLAIVVGDREGFEGEGLSLDASEGLVATARELVSDRMTRLRYRELKDEKEEARKAAASLGVSPSTEALAEFAALFEAPLVLSMSLKVRFDPAQGDPEVLGHLGGRAQALVYHRSTGTVLAQVQVRSSEPKALGPNTSLKDAADGVARELGLALARDVSARLFERLYASQ